MQVLVENLTKRYGEQVAVDNLSFTLKKGEITGFLGTNGAGKSTTMKILTGALLPDAGKVQVAGFQFPEQLKQAQQITGYLPEHNPLYLEMYVPEYLHFVAELYRAPKNRIPIVMEQTHLTHEAKKRIGALSKGYRQRVGLAAALVHDPQVLILDEPTTGLDPNQIIEIRNIIKNLSHDKVILLSSHIMQEIEAICQRVIILNRGKLVLNKPMNELQGNQQQIQVLFDYRVEEQLLKKIPQLDSSVNQGDAFYTLYFSTDEDMRPHVFDFATQNGLRILQINHKHTDLEKLFTQLTQ